jgi:predicted ATP-grasp superfamily ATP-dependent carboligase
MLCGSYIPSILWKTLVMAMGYTVILFVRDPFLLYIQDVIFENTPKEQHQTLLTVLEFGVKIAGAGMGASLLLDNESRLISALCHRRVREYPITGGPSTCCESIYDAEMIDQAYRLLKSFGFVGMAMVEFKGDCVLEVNPRVWGSFPMTERAQSPFVSRYGRAAAGEKLDYAPGDYRVGVKLRFTLNDGAAALSLLKHGRVREFGDAAADLFRVKDALAAADDPKPLRRYLFGSLRR